MCLCLFLKDGVAYDSVCRKCWWKIEQFHEFYIQIEDIHNAIHGQESIFAESIMSEQELSTKATKFGSNLKFEQMDKLSYDEQSFGDIIKLKSKFINSESNVSIQTGNATLKKEERKLVKESTDHSLPKKISATAPLSYQ